MFEIVEKSNNIINKIMLMQVWNVRKFILFFLNQLVKKKMYWEGPEKRGSFVIRKFSANSVITILHIKNSKNFQVENGNFKKWQSSTPTKISRQI